MKKAKRLSAALTAAALAAVVLYAGPAVASDTGQSNSENNLVSEQAPQSESFSEEVASTVTNQDHGRNEITLLDELATSSDMEAQLGNSATAANPGLKSECPDPVFMAYYRTWRDVKMPHNANSDLPDPNVIAMTDLPYGVDIVSLFHYVDPSKNIDQSEFWNTVRDVYVPALHERGTKVIRTIGIDEFFKPT